MPLQRALSGLMLPDLPTPATTFVFGGTDKLDVVALNADVKVELIESGGIVNQFPIRVRRGLHKPIVGLGQAYPPRGVEGFRFSNWTPGAVATVDFEAYSLGIERRPRA